MVRVNKNSRDVIVLHCFRFKTSWTVDFGERSPRTQDCFASCQLLIKVIFILIENLLRAYGDGEFRIEDHPH